MSEYDEYLSEPVSKTRVGAVEISTIICFSGGAKRRVAETLIFIDDGVTVPGLIDQDGGRDEKEAARSLHNKWVKKVRAAYAAAYVEGVSA